jgi:DNA-binding MarR family transcriptional regulator
MDVKTRNPTMFGFLDGHIGFQLHLCGRAAWRLARTSVRPRRARRPSGFNSALVVIGLNPGIAPKQLAEALFLDPQATATLLDHLENEELVHRVRSETDRRRVQLTLTDKGADEMRTVEERSSEQEDRLAMSLAPEERETLVRLLAKLRMNISA